MAKKNSFENTSSKGDSLFSLINKFDKSSEILSESTTAVIKEYIPTGNYILNAAITGSLFRGIPSGRVVTLAGDPGCLEKNEKVEIYIMKGVSQKHDKIKED